MCGTLNVNNPRSWGALGQSAISVCKLIPYTCSPSQQFLEECNEGPEYVVQGTPNLISPIVIRQRVLAPGFVVMLLSLELSFTQISKEGRRTRPSRA